MTTFADFSDEKMEKLFEDFVIEFFCREQSSFRVNHHGRRITWNDGGTLPQYRPRLPQMEADVILEAPERRVIVDAKYYRDALGGRFGGKLRSDHLYQLLAYLRNRDAKESAGPKHEGMLLYPTVSDPLVVDVVLEGFTVRARSINLAQNWRGIHQDMLDLIE